MAITLLTFRSSLHICVKGLSGVDKSFFEANNAEAQKTRENMAAQVLDEAYEWLSAGADDVSSP